MLVERIEGGKIARGTTEARLLVCLLAACAKASVKMSSEGQIGPDALGLARCCLRLLPLLRARVVWSFDEPLFTALLVGFLS